MRGRLRRLGLALALLMAAAPARSVEAVDRLTEEAARFTGSAMVFVFFHELGHALIDLFDLPTVGREEDVVDEFAALVLLKGAREAGGQDAQVAIEALVLAAEPSRLLWKGTEGALRRGRAFPWWDEHSLDIQRYYNILCLIYGSDPGRFWPLVVKAEMPVPRARKCEAEYAQREKAWERLFAGKYAPEGQPRRPGAFGRLVFFYGETRSAFGRELEQGMRESGGFAQIVDALNEVLLLPPGEIPVIAQDCGFANAYWSGDEKRIVLCWEMFRFFLDAWIEEAKAQARQGTGPRPQPQPQTQTQPPGPPVAGLDMGPLQPLLRTGRDGPWTLAVEAGRFLLRNPGDADNLWRMFVPGEPPPAGRRRVTLTVAAEGAPQGRGGGLAYAIEEAAERAFYLLLDGSGGLALRAEAREGGRPHALHPPHLARRRPPGGERSSRAGRAGRHPHRPRRRPAARHGRGTGLRARGRRHRRLGHRQLRLLELHARGRRSAAAATLATPPAATGPPNPAGPPDPAVPARAAGSAGAVPFARATARGADRPAARGNVDCLARRCPGPPHDDPPRAARGWPLPRDELDALGLRAAGLGPLARP